MTRTILFPNSKMCVIHINQDIKDLPKSKSNWHVQNDSNSFSTLVNFPNTQPTTGTVLGNVLSVVLFALFHRAHTKRSIEAQSAAHFQEQFWVRVESGICLVRNFAIAASLSQVIYPYNSYMNVLFTASDK